jgi:ABC-type sugar transport system permease subunit
MIQGLSDMMRGSVRGIVRDTGGARDTQRLRNTIREQIAGWGFLLPSLTVIGIFTLIPIGFSLWLSFYRWDMMRPNRVFIGLANYQRMFEDPRFWGALQNTLLYVLITVPASIALGLGAAILLNTSFRGRAIFRTAFFAPVVTSTVAMSLVWSWIYHPELGLLNGLLDAVGGSRVGWLR